MSNFTIRYRKAKGQTDTIISFAAKHVNLPWILEIFPSDNQTSYTKHSRKSPSKEESTKYDKVVYIAGVPNI